MKRSKYRNKGSISYLSWKANNDRLREVTKLLQGKARALADFTEHVHYVFDNLDKFYVPALSTRQFKLFDYSTLVQKIENYSGVYHKYISDILDDTGNAYNHYWEKAFPNDGPGLLSTNCSYQIKSLDRFSDTFVDLDLHVKVPIRKKLVEQDSEVPRVDFNLLLKSILEKAKNTLDKQLSGYRGSVFISTTPDVRGRIRIFLRSLHTPNHDGKDEDSDRIVNKDRCNTNSFNKKKSINGKEDQFKGGGRLCYHQVRK